MFSFKTFFILVLALFMHNSFTLRVELNVVIRGKQVKLICGPDKLNDTSNNILWQGEKLGIRDLHRLSMRKVPLPNIRVNSNHLKCYLQNSESDSTSKKSRVEREVAGTVQAENGNCPPGYRIDQDRCYPCFPGSFTSGQETECFLCPRNFYISKEAADVCWPCPEGTGTRTEGASSEDACVDLGYSGVRGGNGHKWYIAGIMLILFLILSWIIIAFLIRFWCCEYFRKEKVITIEDGGLMKSTTPDDKILAKSIAHEHFLHQDESKFDEYHIADYPTKKKLLKFDVDIKGSATFTEKGSAETGGIDTEDKGLKHPRRDTISLLKGLKSSEVEDSPLSEFQSPEVKTTSLEFEKKDENRAHVQNYNDHSNNYLGNNKVSEDLIDISKSYLINDDSKIMDDGRNTNQFNNSKHISRDLEKAEDNTKDSHTNINQTNNMKLDGETFDNERENKMKDNYGKLDQIENAEENKIMNNFGNINQAEDLKHSESDTRLGKENSNININRSSNQTNNLKQNEKAFEKSQENSINSNYSKDPYNTAESEETSSYPAEIQEESSSSGTEKSSTQREISAQYLKPSKNGISARNSFSAKKNSVLDYGKKPIQSESGKLKHNSFYYPRYQNSQKQDEQTFSGTTFKKIQNSSCKIPIYCIRQSSEDHVHSDESLNARNSLTAKNSAFDNGRKLPQSESGKLKQNSFYYQNDQKRQKQDEQTFTVPTFRKIEDSSCKNTIYCLRRSSENHVHSDESLNVLYRRSSTDSSSSDANSISQKYLNENHKTFPTKPNQKPNQIRITVEKEPEQELLGKNTHSDIPQFISSKIGTSVTERTSCPIHQDINNPAPRCHVEIALIQPRF